VALFLLGRRERWEPVYAYQSAVVQVSAGRSGITGSILGSRPSHRICLTVDLWYSVGCSKLMTPFPVFHSRFKQVSRHVPRVELPHLLGPTFSHLRRADSPLGPSFPTAPSRALAPSSPRLRTPSSPHLLVHPCPRPWLARCLIIPCPLGAALIPYRVLPSSPYFSFRVLLHYTPRRSSLVARPIVGP
jgi:hypothetical protein